MCQINLTTEELKNLSFPISGQESYIAIYRKPTDTRFIDHYEELRGKILRVYKSKEEIERKLKLYNYDAYLRNKQKKVLEFEKMDHTLFKYLNAPIGPVYLDDNFYASYQNAIFNATTLQDKCLNPDSSNYTNLTLITSFIKQIQDGIRYEMHPNQIYTDDLHSSNILIDKNGQIHFIDADSFRVKDCSELSKQVKSTLTDKQFSNYYSGLPKNPKYLENGIFRATPQRDIYFIYAHFIELITKVNLSYLNENQIYQLLQKSKFPNEFIDGVATCFNQTSTNKFIDTDLIDKMSTDYQIQPVLNRQKKIERCTMIKK